jgi:Helix-turn-helix family
MTSRFKIGPYGKRFVFGLGHFDLEVRPSARTAAEPPACSFPRGSRNRTAAAEPRKAALRGWSPVGAGRTMRDMDYAEAKAAFFQPRPTGAAPPGSSAWRSPARQLRDAIEPIATISFWSEVAYNRYAAVGLDFLTGYVWSRASVLGEPEAPVVAAAFGVFEPVLVAALYDAARKASGLAEIRAAREAGAVESLHRVLGEPDGLVEAVEQLRRGVAAADPTGRPMHAGLTGLPWPADPLGQLWHACTTLREHRGDGHVAVYVAAGLTGLEANLLTELHVGWDPLAYTATRGWSPEAMQAGLATLETRGLVAGAALTDAGRRLRDDLEDRTDRVVQPVVDAIDADLPALIELLAGWSRRITEYGWFPPDPYKWASG